MRRMGSTLLAIMLALLSSCELRSSNSVGAPRTTLAVAPATIADTDIKRDARAGGVALTGDELRALHVDRTYYYATPSGENGATYFAPDGRMAWKPRSGSAGNGRWTLVADWLSITRASGQAIALQTLRFPDGTYRHYGVNGALADSVAGWAPGNPENLSLP